MMKIFRFKQLILFIIIYILLKSTMVFASQKGETFQTEMSKFFPQINSFVQNVPSKPKLVTICETEVNGKTVTFIGAKKNKALIVSLTKHHINDPSRDVILSPLYVVKNELPHPLGYDPRSETSTMDWAYIFDRDSNGKIDYLAYLESPLPVLPEDYGGEQPVIIGNIKGKEFKLAFKNTKMVFWHIGDENSDGEHDSLILPIRNETTGWIDS